MKVIVTGATGLVGNAVVRSCIAHPNVTSIVIISRRPVSESIAQNAKVKVILHDNFRVYPIELLGAVDDAIACLWALGLKGEPLGYLNSSYAEEVEIEYPLTAARTFATSLARDTKRPFRFVLCSGVGAVLDQEKPLWMLRDTRRLKGLAEESVHEITHTDPSFETYTCRPLSIVPEDIGLLASIPFMLMSNVKVGELAAVMTELGISGSGEKWIWENDDIGIQRWIGLPGFIGCYNYGKHISAAMAIKPYEEDSNVSNPIKRIRWATQRVSGASGQRKRHSIMNRFHYKRSSSGEKKSDDLEDSPRLDGIQAEADGRETPRETTDTTRRIFFNIPLPPDAKDAQGHPLFNFGRNKIRTAKYTPLSFVPKNLWFQFHNVANVYFLFVIILSIFPIFGAANAGLDAVPLIVILFITAVKDGIEDWRRTVLDNELNNSPVHRLVDYHNVNSSADDISLWRRIKKATTRGIITTYRFFKVKLSRKGHTGKTYAQRALDERRVSHDTVRNRNSGMTSRTSFHSVQSLNDGIQMTPVPSPSPGQKRVMDGDRLIPGEPLNSTSSFNEDTGPNAANGYLSMPKEEKKCQSDQVPKKSYGSLIDPLKSVPEKAKFKKDYWKSVQVGDFVRIYNNDQIPADVVILSTSDPDGACYVETKNLDGETNLKVRQALPSGRNMKHARHCEQAEFIIESEPPHANLYQYSGVVHWNQRNLKQPGEPGTPMAEPISINNLLLRGCSLRNTEWVLGVVIFTGQETKIMVNAGITPSKRARIARELNWNVIYNFIILFFMCLISGIIQGVTWAQGNNSLDYFEFGSIAGSPPLDGFITFWASVILFQNLVPIALYISLEIIRTAQAFFIYSDSFMYYDKVDYPCTPKSWNISDDLGQIEYIFSDKTGTLTQNVMEFKKCSINGVPYGEAYTEAQAGMQKRQGIDIEAEGAKARTQIAEDRTRMLENLRKLHPNPYLHDDELTFVAPDFVGDLEGSSGREQKVANEQFMLALALCHTVITERTPGDPPRIEFKAQSPDEAALVATARDCGFTVMGRSNEGIILNIMGEEREYTVLNTLEFNSSRKRMSAIIRMPDGKIMLFCKGADSVIYSRLKRGEQQELRKITAEHLEMFAREGLRTLCVAQKEIDEQTYQTWNMEHDLAAAAIVDRDDKLEMVSDAIERDLMLIGGTAIEDRLQDGVPDTIALLGDAGIKLWVLTGDKVETAINIGFSCNLLSNEMDLIVFKIGEESIEAAAAELDKHMMTFGITGSDEELKAARKNHEPPGPTHAIIIDGDSLTLLLEEELRQKFLLLCKQCKSVLCCRVSPSQKASVVRMVKDGLDVMTLSIGDGANDVAMIQEADVGVGIAGEEGRQAVMSSDYAIGQFRFLQRLILVHGRWSYRRLAETIANFFYKNIVWTFALFWYQIYNNFDCSYLVDYTYILLVNLAFTSLPVIFMGILDQDVSDKVSLAVPQLYRRGIERKEWSQLKFWLYMFDGIYQSLICFFMPYLLFAAANSVTGDGLSVNDSKRIGVYVACADIVVVNVYILLNTYRWDWLMLLLVSISILLIWAWTGAYTAFRASAQFYKAAPEVYGQLSFWVLTLLTVIICLLPRFSIKAFQKIYLPLDVDIIREQVRQGKFKHLDKYDAYGPPAKMTSTSSSDISQPLKAPPGKQTPFDDDERPIYPPSIAATGTTHNPRSQTGSDGTDYTGHKRSLERPTRPSFDRPRPSFDRLRSSMEQVRPSFEASNDFTSAALLSRMESSHSDVPQRPTPHGLSHITSKLNTRISTHGQSYEENSLFTATTDFCQPRMTELVTKLQELQDLPPELHWFCEEWTSTDGSPSSNPRIKIEHALGQDVGLRRNQAAECLTVYSYDDAYAFQEQLGRAIDLQLGRCDVCIEEYYKAKQKLVEKLAHDYDEDDVRIVAKAFDNRDIERIKRGLDNATRILKRLEPPQRHKNALKLPFQLALFEALCNNAFLADEDLLKLHFQEPFTLVQTNKRLNIARYIPAATAFLFDTDHDRWIWATQTWSRYRQVPTKEQFEFAIKDGLFRNMQRVFGSVTDETTLQRTWYGIGLIVDNLDNNLVTHSLRAMEIDVFMLALDHLKYDVPSFRYLVETIQKLLELAPKDFWDAMGAISPTTFIEQIFNNKQYDKFMEQAHSSDIEEASALKDMLTWIKPFMASLDTAHQAGVCRSLAFQLLDRLQAERFPAHSRTECYRTGLATLAWTLNNCNKDGITLTQTGRIVTTETLEVVSGYINEIAKISSLPDVGDIQISCSELSLRVIKLALALECKAAKTDQESLRQMKEHPDPPAGYAAHAATVWDAVVQNLDYGNVDLAKAALIGINDLTGLEKFKINADDPHAKEKSGYNIKHGRLTHLVCQIMERINDFSPRDLDKLYRVPETATALVASLFAADANLYQAGVNLVKSISSESARKEAIGHLLRTFFSTTLNAFSWAIRRIARNRTYSSSPRMLKTSSDVLDVLCDSQDGLLRTRALSGMIEIKALENFWQHQWEGLKVIYEMTEEWARNKADDPNALKEFCRDTMQFSERLFDQYSIFASAVESASAVKLEDEPNDEIGGTAAKKLLEYPASTTQVLVKWLRLRDLFLVGIAVKLTEKVLNRLTEMCMTVEEGTSRFLELVINGGSQGRTHLTPQEKAELARALEANLGRTVVQPPIDVDSETPSDRSREPSLGVQRMKKTKSMPLDFDSWRAKPQSAGQKSSEPYPSGQVIEVSDEDEFSNADIPDQEMLSVSRSVEMMKKMKEQQATLSSAKLALPNHEKKAAEPNKFTRGLAKLSRPIQSEAERALFRERREKEKDAKKKRDLENLAMVRKRVGVAGQTIGEGSGLNGIGVKGKDHAPSGPSMMVSSGSESDSEDDLDAGLFGGDGKTTKVSDAVKEYRANKVVHARQGPIRKTRQVRSAKDMRARLAPDLTVLHKTILSWNFFHNSDFPPGTQQNDYSLVTNTFRTPLDYERTFQPLLILEAWQGFLKSKEEGNFRTFEVSVANRMNVDAFLEVSSTMSITEAKDLGIGEADIVIMSKAQSPANDAKQPHCLARVWRISRKKGTMDVTFRANVGNSLVTSMVPNSTLYCSKISSITPLEREYGALLGLKYFDLCDEITRAKPSPLLEYSDKQLNPLVENYEINTAQAKAVRSAIDNDAFTLIQGPPGSGKTKTIVAIVGALLTSSFADKGQTIARPQANNLQGSRNNTGVAAKKLLVCAPSNAAVDELVMRFKQGIKTIRGEHQRLNVIRLGRSDAINANVMDVTLEELVNAKLNIASGKKPGLGDDIGRLMQAHKATCEEFNTLRDTVDGLRATGMSVSPQQNRNLEVLKRKKQQLSNQIDLARDSGDMVARDAEISRRHVQQEILDAAHVICATLSGSGHEMFQGLNIEFETVVIDEAAQSIELSALIPLKYGCSKCILVGDPKQLPPTVLSREAARFQYEQSLFVRMQANHPCDVHLLDTQYRMHPEISLFPSSSFYDGKLLDGAGMAKLRSRPWHQNDILGPYRFFDVQGTHQSAPRGHSLINLAEVEVALNLYNRLTSDCRGYDFKGKIGIITPYKSQLRELRSRFAQRYGEAILTAVDFNTTDAFQGRESEIILFSCVRASLNKGIGFLSDIRRMNVGITRAKSSLWVLGHSQSLMQGEYWGRLIEDAKKRNRYTTGDLNALLQRPLLSLDMKFAVPNGTPVPLAHTSAGDDDVDMSDVLPAYNSSSTISRSSTALGSPARTTTLFGADQAIYCPSGGGNGFNEKRNCMVCGSFAHQTNNCTNREAIENIQGGCHRCGEMSHLKKHCTAARCLVCGEIGHAQENCTSTNTLSQKERHRIGRQEIEHKMARDREPELQRKKQLGDHDRKVPTVKETESTPPPAETESKKKRKRAPSPPTSAPKGPRMANGAANVLRGASHELVPSWKSVDGNRKYENRHPSPRSSTGQSQSSQNPPDKPPHTTTQSEIQNSESPGPPHPRINQVPTGIIKVGEGATATGPFAPRLPLPAQNMVRPPKKKKDADPFIRPKIKR
ncbi:MAG: hypothetical protein Q9217_000229 [Psora testacea]